jgi:hypothetical protein
MRTTGVEPRRERVSSSTLRRFTTVCGVTRPWATCPRSSMNKPRDP